MRRKRVLVTGATGFLGKNLVPVLLRKKYAVEIVTRNERRPYSRAVSYHVADLNHELPTTAVKNVDTIVHLAGEIAIGASLAAPRERIDHNVGMTLSLLEATRLSGKKPLVVFISTTQLYGRTKKRIVTEEETAFPVEPYSASKIMCETLLQMYNTLYGIPYIILRTESFYGPHQRKGMFISDTIVKMLTADTISTGTLSPRRNFTYAGDVVEAICAALEAPVRTHNQIYNITGTQISMRKVVATLAKIIGTPRGTKIRITEIASIAQSGLIINEFAVSTRKAQRLLTWRPRTKLAAGLGATVTYFVNQSNTA